MLQKAFLDVLNGCNNPDDIQKRTGLPAERCEELYNVLLLARLDVATDAHVTLEMSKQQAHVVINALDVLTRLGMGQFEIITETLVSLGIIKDGDRRFHVENEIALMKSSFGFPANGSYGITNPKTATTSKIAYDLLCVLRKPLADPNQPHNTWHNDPLHTAKDVPLAKAKVNPYAV